MATRRYYSVRTGKNKSATEIDLVLLKRLFHGIYSDLNSKDYFQEAFGYYCYDDGEVSGKVGYDIELFFFKMLRKQNLWPIAERYPDYTEDDLFDVIELLYDVVSKPLDGYFHAWNQCGWHYKTFDKQSGQTEYRNEINACLRDYHGGYELSKNGEILFAGESGLKSLLDADMPGYDEDNVDSRLAAAVVKFRRHRSSFQDRKDAVRDLADILEFLRPQIKELNMNEDERDLFNIANNFAIRHHNDKQKSDYDIYFLTWIFYAYLSSIHLCTRLIKRQSE